LCLVVSRIDRVFYILGIYATETNNCLTVNRFKLHKSSLPFYLYQNLFQKKCWIRKLEIIGGSM
jgi:hypothetical protein